MIARILLFYQKNVYPNYVGHYLKNVTKKSLFILVGLLIYTIITSKTTNKLAQIFMSN